MTTRTVIDLNSLSIGTRDSVGEILALHYEDFRGSGIRRGRGQPFRPSTNDEGGCVSIPGHFLQRERKTGGRSGSAKEGLKGEPASTALPQQLCFLCNARYIGNHKNIINFRLIQPFGTIKFWQVSTGTCEKVSGCQPLVWRSRKAR
jgi:hypothetical protein